MRLPFNVLFICLFVFGDSLLGVNDRAYADTNFETIPTDEAADIEKILKLVETQMRRSFHDNRTSGNAKAKRGAHAKSHGCVRGELRMDELVPNEFRRGIFSSTQGQAITYGASIRFSNGSAHVESDQKGDARGIAIKLFDTPGEKILEDTFLSQDFLLVDHPVFIVKNAKEYVEFERALTNGNLMEFFFPVWWNPSTWRTKEALIAKEATNKPLRPVFAINYFSVTPYLFGVDRAVKFGLRSCSSIDFGGGSGDSSPNYLRHSLSRYLENNEVCFDFVVQTQRNPRKQPVEDPTVEWSERDSPFIKIAQLRIPSQVVGHSISDETCERLVFNPWHASLEHRPLGGINRIRKAVYQMSSALRAHLSRLE